MSPRQSNPQMIKNTSRVTSASALLWVLPICLCFGTAAWGTSVPPGTSLSAMADAASPPSTGGPSCSMGNSDTTTPAACGVAWTFPALSALGSGNAWAAANFGVLRDSIDATTIVGLANGGTVQTQAAATAGFTDTLTFPGLAVNASLTLSISLSGSGTGAFTAIYQVILADAFLQENQCAITLTAGGSSTCTFSLPIVPSDTVGIAASLNLNGFATILPDNVGTNTMQADFTHTAIVTGLMVLDANGNPIPGVSVLAASGTNYNNLSPTPEPETLVLLGSSVLGLYIARVRRGFSE